MATRFAILSVLSVLVTPAVLSAADELDLGVSRVAIFSSGVGYFECDTKVTGDATATLNFRTDQINDVIKSMVVQDYSGGRIGVIRYAAQDPIDRTLKSFAVDLTGRPTLGQLLDQLRGEPVALTGGKALSGTIVGVEKTTQRDPDGKVVEEVEWLTLLTDGGLQRIPLQQVAGIKLTNDKIDAELRKALTTLAGSHAADKKAVEVAFTGVGERQVRVAYLLEAPIWKTSYRLVLAENEKPFLQGWATVENATEEDWNDVQLSLVSGRPISFRMDLYTPLYVPRPLEQLELFASLRPPELEAPEERAKAIALGIVPAAAPMPELKDAAGRPARGTVDVYFTSSAEGSALTPEAGVQSVAQAQEAGELFEYRIDAPVTIPRQHSAMLPIVNEAVEAQKVSIFNPANHPKYPLNGLSLTNSTKLHLMQGPVTVFDSSVYAGDAKLPDLKPGEQRLIAYALDLGAEVNIDTVGHPAELVSMKIAKGTLIRRHKYIDERTYNIKNKLDRAKDVLIEQPCGGGWNLVAPAEPTERTANLVRFKVATPAKESKALTVKLERVADESIVLSSVGLDQVEIFLRARVLTPKLKEALGQVVALRTALDAATRRVGELEQQRKEATEDQARIRENLKTLDKSTDAYQRQLKRFDEVDTQINRLAEEIATTRQTEVQRRQEVEAYLRDLSVE